LINGNRSGTVWPGDTVLQLGPVAGITSLPRSRYIARMAKASASTTRNSAQQAKVRPIPGVVVLFGPERLLILERTEALKAAILKAHGDVEVFVWNGESTAPAIILDECRAMSLAMTHKLVIVENADVMLKGSDEDDGDEAAAGPGKRKHGKSKRELMEDYSRAPDPSATLLLRANSWLVSTNLHKAILAEGGQVEACEELSDDQAAQWVVNRAVSQHKVAIEPEAAMAMVRAVGVGLGKLDSELSKLSISSLAAARRAGTDLSKAVITQHDVAELTGESREDEIWGLQSVVASGDVSAALVKLRSLLDVSLHDPVGLMISVQSMVRQIDGACRGMTAGERPESLLGRCKIWKLKDVVIRVARSMNPDRTAAMMRAVVEADSCLKSGQGNPRHVVEVLVLRVTQLFRSQLAR